MLRCLAVLAMKPPLIHYCRQECGSGQQSEWFRVCAGCRLYGCESQLVIRCETFNGLCNVSSWCRKGQRPGRAANSSRIQLVGSDLPRLGFLGGSGANGVALGIFLQSESELARERLAHIAQLQHCCCCCSCFPLTAV